ncbi:c-type cytochrome [Oceaniglobus ichthyenteri]|uniref:c-type cytochrome n=1 Tax=Oceaniglobus ichthyenteri TaxID=2136177 RepID=UPI000D341195|nr:cytochrome c [Oceaniglobus ichthyenteri]
MKSTLAALIALGVVATVPQAFAESHADPVAARMELMKDVGAQTKILGTIAKADFDADAVQAAASALHADAQQIPAKFEANEMTEKSEALPAIWENFDDFKDKAMALEVAAKSAMDATDTATLGAAMGQIGGACKACHEDYRLKK